MKDANLCAAACKALQRGMVSAAKKTQNKEMTMTTKKKENVIVNRTSLRWQSKYKMLSSLFQNKVIVMALCESEDEECQCLHEENVALTVEEWTLIEV